jgi:hypothetical protein
MLYTSGKFFSPKLQPGLIELTETSQKTREAGNSLGATPHIGNTQKIHVLITEEDISGWQDSPIRHPLISALMRFTQTPWHFVEPILLLEKAPPYRSLFLDSRIKAKLQRCKNREYDFPFDCEVELLLPLLD